MPDPRETLIKFDDVSQEIREALTVKGGKAQIDKKWLLVFDTLLKELINTRATIEFAVGKNGVTDWEFVNEAAKRR